MVNDFSLNHICLLIKQRIQFMSTIVTVHRFIQRMKAQILKLLNQQKYFNIFLIFIYFKYFEMESQI